MGIASRLNRLEAAVGVGDTKRYLSVWALLDGSAFPLPEGFDAERDLRPEDQRLFYALFVLPHWLAERGFRDSLAVLEAGAIARVPKELRALVQEQAVRDVRHRAWGRIETALAKGELPTDADIGIWTRE
jgi:hypothetical protein